jgi:hypothetical protein
MGRNFPHTVLEAGGSCGAKTMKNNREALNLLRAGDPGLTGLEIIHRKAMIDEQWTERGVRSFRWLGYRLQQSFDATPSAMQC